MQKHDKMVALAKEKSAEMTETAITAIETMYRKNIKIPVDISHILGNLITVIFNYQILRKPLKILSL
ncbi:hypothetical protein [Roseburia intestinalis]|uniref:hypothetical protein n=1 Tax=Roseburia intestinalis TaxID=166486 RepID=UPI0032BFA7B1